MSAFSPVSSGWRRLGVILAVVLVAILHQHSNRTPSGCKDGHCLTPYGDLVSVNR